jgi:hypothetical protein
VKLRLNIDSTVSLAISLSGRLAIHSYNNFYAFPAATFFRRKLSCFVSRASLLKSNEHSKIELNLPGNSAWGAVKTAFEQVRVLNSARLWCWLRASFWTGRYPLSHCLIDTSAFCYSDPKNVQLMKNPSSLMLFYDKHSIAIGLRFMRSICSTHFRHAFDLVAVFIVKNFKDNKQLLHFIFEPVNTA